MSELSKQTISLDKQLDSAIERLDHRLDDFKVIAFFIVLVNFHFFCLKKSAFYRTRLYLLSNNSIFSFFNGFYVFYLNELNFFLLFLFLFYFI